MNPLFVIIILFILTNNTLFIYYLCDCLVSNIIKKYHIVINYLYKLFFINSCRIFSIDGNIGSGKSTLLNNLKKFYKNNLNVIFLDEPVLKWQNIKDSNGITMIQKFYSDQEKYSFSFQMMAYISRLSIIRNAIKLNPKAIFITERSLLTDKFVFAKMLFDQSKIEDVNYQIYLSWFDEFADDYPIETIIYVNTNPDICYDRIQKRSRLGEEVIPLNYLASCDQYHNEFIKIMSKICNIIELNGNKDVFIESNIINEWIDIIDKRIKS